MQHNIKKIKEVLVPYTAEENAELSGGEDTVPPPLPPRRPPPRAARAEAPDAPPERQREAPASPRQLAAALPTPELRVELRSRDDGVAVRLRTGGQRDAAAGGEVRDAVGKINRSDPPEDMDIESDADDDAEPTTIADLELRKGAARDDDGPRRLRFCPPPSSLLSPPSPAAAATPSGDFG